MVPFCSLYRGSKFAVEGLSEAAALELAPLGVRVKIVEPGFVKTDFSGRSMSSTSWDEVTDCWLCRPTDQDSNVESKECLAFFRMLVF
jgi:short-subunit dehydrogenase